MYYAVSFTNIDVLYVRMQILHVSTYTHKHIYTCIYCCLYYLTLIYYIYNFMQFCKKEKTDRILIQLGLKSSPEKS